jgi:UDP-galactopyranose mutase
LPYIVAKGMRLHQQIRKFNTYQHQVLPLYKTRVYQTPINLETINSFYNLNLRP